MSKSKGEFLTVSLLEEKGYDPLVYRMFCLGSHYRKNLVFSWENLDNAKVAYDKLVGRIAALDPKSGEVDPAALEAGRENFKRALDNDHNTSLAVTAVYDALKLQANDATKLAIIDDYDKVLGLDLLSAAERVRAEKKDGGASDELVAYINERIEARRQAKLSKNYAEADAIRAELLAKGITLVDTKEGTTFSIQ